MDSDINTFQTKHKLAYYNFKEISITSLEIMTE